MKRICIAFIFVLLCPLAVGATTYYVKPAASGGSDAANGLSDATAWATLSKVNSTLAGTTGHSVYFRCNETWTLSGTQKLYVTWKGTSTASVTIGSYYLVGATETVGVDPAGVKPIFDGNNVAPGSTSGFNGIIELALQNISAYITIENIRITNSQSYGIFGRGNYVTVQDCETDETKMGGIVLAYSDHCTIQRNTVNRAATCHTPGQPSANNTCPGHIWPQNLGFTLYSDYNTIAQNSLLKSVGEGIGIYYHCTNNVIEKNVLYDQWAAGIYISGDVDDTTVRNNLVYWTTDTTYWRATSPTRPTTGIWIDEENVAYDASDRTKIYNNIVAGAGNGFWSAAGVVDLADLDLYGNTFVDCYRNINIGTNIESGAVVNVKNNISLCITADGTWPCSQTNSDVPASGITWDYNNWSSLPVANARGANDVTADPLLVQTSGWRALVGGAVTGREAALSATSPAGVKTGGVVLPSPYSTGLDPRALYTDFSALPPLVTGYDRGATPSIGAFPYFADIPEPPPAVPGILTNPGFELGTAWTFYSDGSAAYEESATTPIAETKSGHVTITTAGSNVQLYQTSVPVTASTQYRLSFVARSNVENREIKLRLHKHGSPYTNYGLNNYLIVLHTTNTTYSFDFTTNASATNDARFAIWFADADVAADQFWFDTVTLEATVTPAAKPITTQRLPVVTTPDLLCTFTQAKTTLEIDTDQAGTIALSGSCYSPTTTVGIGVNTMRLTGSTGLPLPPGTYSDCSYIITAGEVASDPVSITSFTVPSVVAHGLRVN